MKVAVIVLGFLSALLILAQLVMGQLIANGTGGKLIKTHQHSGYMTVTVVLVYIALSLRTILSQKSA